MRNFEERLDSQILASWRDAAEEPVTEEWTPDPALTTTDFVIPSSNGAPDVLVRMYHFAEGAVKPVPVVYYIHGGGFTGGSYTELQDFWEKIILETGAAIISVEYRLAPDNPFPAGFDDCYTALEWIAASAVSAG